MEELNYILMIVSSVNIMDYIVNPMLLMTNPNGIFQNWYQIIEIITDPQNLNGTSV